MQFCFSKSNPPKNNLFMKSITLLIISLFLTMMVQAQVSKTVDLTAGSLSTTFTTEELNSITDLTITGTIDARDFKTMRDHMPVLEDVDMHNARIVAYEGDEGPSQTITDYAADEIPKEAFYIPNFGSQTLVSIQLPSTTKVIGPYAFFGCMKLTDISIPSSVTAIGEQALSGCFSITSLSLPESVETIGDHAFSGCNFTTLVLPSKIDSIQPYTFSNCGALVSLEIPSQVTYIGKLAFWSCQVLESITLPSSLKTLGEYAFYQCKALQSITLPPGTTSIGQSSFHDCVSLAGTVTLPEGLPTIKTNTFNGCSSLNSVVIPSSVDSIGEAAFMNCTTLETLSLPSSIVFIGNSAFSQCTNLSGTLVLPSSLKIIGSRAFAHCEKITGELVIPSSVDSIHAEAFTYLRSLTSLVIPSSVTYIGDVAFSFLSSLTSIEVHHLYPLSLHTLFGVFEGVDKSAVTLHVPFGTKERYASAYEWKDFKNIVEDTKGFLLNAVSVSFKPEGGTDNSIQVTADFAWTAKADQSWLTVNPASAENSQTLEISAEANNGLSSRNGTITLSAEGIPSQVIRITQQSQTRVVAVTPGSLSKALSQEEKHSISSLTLTGSMDARDFRTIRFEMPLLEELDIKEVDIEAYTDTTHGNNILYPADAIPFAIYEWNDEPQTAYALSEHPKLAHIKLPVSLKTIGYRAFFATPLKTVEMQSSVEKIGIEAFYASTSLTDINLPSSLTSISERAFKGCTSLVSIELPASLKTIEYETFEECSSLKSVLIPSSITSIGDYAFKGCSSLESVIIPASITIIGLEVFKDCISLKSVNIPSKITYIKEAAFQGDSALRSITLPGSLTAMGPAVFDECINLDTIYTYAVNPPELDKKGYTKVFNNVDKEKCLLYVPFGSRELYAAAYEWEDFKNIIEMGEFRLEEDSVTLEAIANSEATVMLHSSLPWTVSSNQEWLSVTPKSGSGNQLLTLTAQANMDTARTAIVTIAAKNMDPLRIHITQQALATGIDQVAQSTLSLDCYPNPFTQQLVIEITNPLIKDVSVEIYSISGQKIKSLARAQKEAKIYLVWNGNNEAGQKVPAGIYILKMNGESRQVIKK
jgi:hypothetical protein